MHAQSKDFKVAIIGGGIGGLTLAVALAQNGILVDIFEQASKFEEIGAGVAFGSNATCVFRTLGIFDAILERVDEFQRGFRFINGLPAHEEYFDYPMLDSDVAIALYRPDILDTLTNLVPPNIVHFGKKCNKAIQLPSGQVEVTFDDGTKHTAHVVVGCDGIKSVIRDITVGQPSSVKYSGTVAYRGLVPIQDAIAAIGDVIMRHPIIFSGSDKHLVVYTIRAKTLVNVVAFSTDRKNLAGVHVPVPGGPWVVHSSQAEMLSQYEGWGPKVLNLLQNIKQPTKWFLHSHDPPLNTYVRGNIAILGDAAHSMLPHLGAGAGQAIEDAGILSQLLSHPQTNTCNLEVVLEAYDYVRRPRANRVLTASYNAGEVYDCNGPSGGSIEGLRKDLDGLYEWLWHYDLDSDFKEAVKYLEGKKVFTPSS